MRSQLRRRLVGGLAILIVVLSAGIYLLTRRLLVDEFDAAQLAKARLIAAGVKQHPDGTLDIDAAEEPTPEFTRARDPEYFELARAGARVASSPSLGERRLPARGGVSDLALPDGRRGRMLAFGFVPVMETEQGTTAGSGPGLVLLLARGRAELDAALWRVLFAIAAASALLLLGSAAVVQVVLSRMRELESNFERERRFSANVAHELRTPIAELRSLAEVALRWPDTGSFRDVLDIAVQMERMVANLLALARCEHEELALESLDLAQAAREAWRPFEPAAQARQLQATFSLAPAQTRGDRAILGAMLANVYSNAVDYTPAGGRIDCVLSPLAGGAQLVLSNTADGLTRDDVEHALEPFWRKDAARSDRNHGGLGLALVAAYARLTGGEARADLDDDGRFRLTLRFAQPQV
jgi:signal transduction histidine kinase